MAVQVVGAANGNFAGIEDESLQCVLVCDVLAAVLDDERMKVERLVVVFSL